MSETTAGLRRKIAGTGDLQSVVRTMKNLAASGIAQYEASLASLAGYAHTIELGLGACFRIHQEPPAGNGPSKPVVERPISVVVFGSDQGLVGQFNDAVSHFAVMAMATLPGRHEIWAVGERVRACLADDGMPAVGLFAVPNSIGAIGPLVRKILVETEANRARGEVTDLHLFYNRPTSGTLYAPAGQQLLPLNETWRSRLTRLPWPPGVLPEIIGTHGLTLRALIREYLFISLFRACAESLASENTSRLMAMQRAEKNIDERLDGLKGTFHRWRQSAIDEELFDIIAGFEALSQHHSMRPDVKAPRQNPKAPR